MKIWQNRQSFKLWPIVFLLVCGSGRLCGQQFELKQPSSWGDDESFQISAKYFCETDSPVGYLIIQVELAEGRYLYSLTQPGQLATKIEVSFGGNAKSAGALRPATPPEVKDRDEFLQTRSEKHFGFVEFVLPIRQLTDKPPRDWKVAVRMNGQVCSDAGSCVLIQDRIIQATYAELDSKSKERLADMCRPEPESRR